MSPYTLQSDTKVDEIRGISIDLNVCTGCSACYYCLSGRKQLAVVGKGGKYAEKGGRCTQSRDRYYRGNLDEPEVFSQPVPCMQCEDAPCELVCPVAATVRGPEGINEMVYNRCVAPDTVQTTALTRCDGSISTCIPTGRPKAYMDCVTRT